MTPAEQHAEYYRGLEIALDALRGRGNAPPAERASAVHRAITPILEDTPVAAQRDCASGCAHCCHFPVGITYPEAQRLLDALDSNPELKDAVRRDYAATHELDWHELAGRPCPLLQNDACAAYAARPVACRALASTDAGACRDALSGQATVPADDAAFARGLGAVAALAAGSPAGTRELRHALANLTDAATDGSAAAFEAARSAAPPDRAVSSDLRRR